MEDLVGWALSDIARGFRHSAGRYTCAVCGRNFENGEVYCHGGRFFDARRMAEMHLADTHGGMLNVLLALDKRYSGLTDNQKELLRLLHDGLCDREIAEKTGVTASTVRHQRFMFREKAKQANIFLAALELALGASRPGGGTADVKAPGTEASGEELIDIHRGATMVDERYLVTKAEEEAIIATMFSSLDPLKLKLLSPKEKKKIVILRRISEQFKRDRTYTEKELNAVFEGHLRGFRHPPAVSRRIRLHGQGEGRQRIPAEMTAARWAPMVLFGSSRMTQILRIDFLLANKNKI